MNSEALTHSSPLRAKTPTCPTSDTIPEELAALSDLFQKMNNGEHPNFLDMMAAISEMVAFYTDHDTPADLAQIEEFFMSQKKCRFCY